MRGKFPVRTMAAATAGLLAAACTNGTTEAFPTPPVFVATPTAAPTATTTPTPATPIAEAASAIARVVVTSPLYDSPGARVPIVVTVYNGPATLPAEALGAVAGGGARVEACGVSWHNPAAHSLSHACQLVLPTTHTTVALTGIAVWHTPDGARQSLRSPARAVQTKGPGSAAVSPAQAEAIARCGNTGDEVWLTFDDYVPSLAVARAMVAVLERNRVRGRFFLNQVTPATRRLLEAAGNVVTNHTRDHLALSDLSESKIGEEIRTGPATTPGAPRLLRPPYGAGAWSSRVVEVIEAGGHAPCRWTVDTRDWAGRNPAEMADAVRWGDLYSPPVDAGGVILMHANHFSPAKLQAVLDAVKARGLVIEPVPAARWPPGPAR